MGRGTRDARGEALHDTRPVYPVEDEQAYFTASDERQAVYRSNSDPAIPHLHAAPLTPLNASRPRVKLGHMVACTDVRDRVKCSESVDGRTQAYYKDQPCVAAHRGYSAAHVRVTSTERKMGGASWTIRCEKPRRLLGWRKPVTGAACTSTWSAPARRHIE